MKRLFSVLMSLCLAGLLAACRRESGGPAAEAAAVVPPQPIRIGAIFSVTGPASFLGLPEARTATMLVERLNAEGGVLGRPLELIIKDSGGSPEKAVSFAKQLIEEDDVVAILGPATSGETMQIKALCEENGMIMMSCAAAEVIVNPVASYVFKTAQKDSQAVSWIYGAMDHQGISRVGIVFENSGFGQAGKVQLESMAKDAGIEIVASEAYDRAATDLTDILAKLKARDVQAVVNWSIVPAQAIVARNMKQIGLDVPLFQSHGFGNVKYAEQVGAAGNGLLFPGSLLLVVDQLADDHPQKAVLNEYKTAYESRYNEDVSAFGGYAHDALMIVVAAMRKAGTTERAAVREAIENLHGFVGITGVFHFSAEDHNGLGMDAFEMLTVRDGKFYIHEK